MAMGTDVLKITEGRQQGGKENLQKTDEWDFFNFLFLLLGIIVTKTLILRPSPGNIFSK